MTQEQKELLLKDLCARLPYGVKVKCRSNKMICIGDWELDTITLDRIFNEDTKYVPFDEFPPYLFPLSSMTEEQNRELSEILFNLEMEHLQDNETGFTIKGSKVAQAEIDWYNKNHFDYRGLIPMGLAIDATGLNIY